MALELDRAMIRTLTTPLAALALLAAACGADAGETADTTSTSTTTTTADSAAVDGSSSTSSTTTTSSSTTAPAELGTTAPVPEEQLEEPVPQEFGPGDATAQLPDSPTGEQLAAAFSWEYHAIPAGQGSAEWFDRLRGYTTPELQAAIEDLGYTAPRQDVRVIEGRVTEPEPGTFEVLGQTLDCTGNDCTTGYAFRMLVTVSETAPPPDQPGPAALKVSSVDIGGGFVLP